MYYKALNILYSDELDESQSFNMMCTTLTLSDTCTKMANKSAMASIKAQAAPRGQEPPMYLQRPSTGRSQDVRHILARTFRDLYTRDAVRPDTVKNLQVSKGGDDPYHERYVDNLQQVQ